MKDLTILSWNVRGINNPVASRNVSRAIRESKANVICIQETKNSGWSDSLMNSIWDSENHDWIVVNSIGNAGGLLVSWINRNCLFIRKIALSLGYSVEEKLQRGRL